MYTYIYVTLPQGRRYYSYAASREKSHVPTGSYPAYEHTCAPAQKQATQLISSHRIEYPQEYQMSKNSTVSLGINKTHLSLQQLHLLYYQKYDKN